MEERRTINAPLRLSTAFMCVSLAAVRLTSAFLDTYPTWPLMRAPNRHAKINAFSIQFEDQWVWEERCDRNMEIQSVSNFRRRKFVENLVLVCREERWKCLHAKCNNWRNKNFSQFLTFRIRNWKKKRKKNTYLNNV